MAYRFQRKFSDVVLVGLFGDIDIPLFSVYCPAPRSASGPMRILAMAIELGEGACGARRVCAPAILTKSMDVSVTLPKEVPSRISINRRDFDGLVKWSP